MGDRVKIMIEISKLIEELKETDIYYLQQQCRVDLTGPMQEMKNAMEIIIDRSK